MADAQCHFHIATQLIAHANLESKERHASCIELAIASLELSLNLPSAVLSLEDELKCRLLLGQILYKYTTNLRAAEELITKGLIKVQNQASLLSYKLAFYDLLSNILHRLGSTNVAKRVLKDAINMCENHFPNLIQWHYVFLFRFHEVETSAGSIRAIRNLAHSRQDLQILKVVDVLELITKIRQGVPVVSEVSMPLTRDTEAMNAEVLTTVEYTSLAMSVLQGMISGNVAKTIVPEDDISRASTKLAIIHKGLDSQVSIDSTIRCELHGITNMDGSQQYVIFQAMSNSRFMIFMYVLSGVLHLPDITSSRSAKFLEEGEKQLMQERHDSEVDTSDPWLTTMEEIIHLYKTFNFLLHSQLSHVQKEISYLKSESPLRSFLMGCYEQQSGHFGSALQWYAHLPPGDLLLLAKLNTVVIYMGPAMRNDLVVKNMISDLETHCVSGAYQTIFHLVKSQLPGTTSVSLKRILTGVLNAAKDHANTQLSTIALSMLSVQSSDPDDMKLKFSSHALRQTNKYAVAADGMNIWSHLNGSVVAGAMEQAYTNADPSEQASAIEKLEKFRGINAQNLFKMKTSMPQVYDTLGPR